MSGYAVARFFSEALRQGGFRTVVICAAVLVFIGALAYAAKWVGAYFKSRMDREDKMQDTLMRMMQESQNRTNENYQRIDDTFKKTSESSQRFAAKSIETLNAIQGSCARLENGHKDIIDSQNSVKEKLAELGGWIEGHV